MTESVESSPKRAPRLLVLGLLVLVGLLATITIVLIEHARLQTAVASNGQDTSTSSLGLTSQGFDTPTAGTSNAVADIAARLATNALSFAPQSFDAKVAEAKSHMTIAMQASYQRLLTAHNTRKVVVIGGVTIKTTVVHDSNDPKKQAYLGVVSLTPTQGEFLMMVQGVATVTGSTREAVTPLMLDVTVQRIGNAWLLEDIKTCQAPTRAGQTFCSAI
ncbi:MAG TPA: hypothetical protein VN108_00310 [Marmoricola sp.]|nr:hypothetical protein [Marmoricola sp.]